MGRTRYETARIGARKESQAKCVPAKHHSLTSLLPVDAESSLAAIRLRNAAPSRLPLADALIAGVADATGLILVHRDPHFDSIPGIKVLHLPNKR